MSNPNPRTDKLVRQTPKWLHQPTRALRVPEAFLTEIESYARKLDQGVANQESEIEQQGKKPTQVIDDAIACFGIRPSISELGWAVIRGKANEHPRVVDFGVVSTNAKQEIASRLGEIESDLSELLREFQPKQVILEKPFVNLEYASTAAKTLQCLGVVQATIYRQCHLSPVLIYPATWKNHVDSPRASREDLAFSVKLLFDIDRLPLNASVDAIAIAYAGFCGLGGSIKS